MSNVTLMQAIARQEGFYVEPPAPSLARDRNNPGNMEDGKWAQAHGALPSDGNRFARWPTPEAGFEAMRHLLVYNYLGKTITDVVHIWCPASETSNNDEIYIEHVCEWTGLTPDAVLTSEMVG